MESRFTAITGDQFGQDCQTDGETGLHPQLRRIDSTPSQTAPSPPLSSAPRRSSRQRHASFLFVVAPPTFRTLWVVWQSNCCWIRMSIEDGA
ncbi:unnamed protein product [Cercopithifilaria johnstoni]|uniref:Uncharacterized protein n=1 Tax=Cercopithifilaria johnstoni TaxID=2874296 RepID=A0A8J2M2V5_9BILA|nr:unnamed protein product [Cercopithifilaria johnstoni]